MSYHILYHNNCPDGFTAAWAVNKWLENRNIQPSLVPMDYSMEPPAVRGANVIMVDFCFDDVKHMTKIIREANSFLLLDHHKTGLPWFKENPFYNLINDAENFGMYESYDDLFLDVGIDRVLDKDEIRICIDVDHSGAALAGLYTKTIELPDWTLETVDAPNEFIYYVEDRDLWKFKLPGSHKFTAYLGSFDYSLSKWDEVAKPGSVAIALREGEPILRYRDQLIQQMVSLAQPVQLDEFEMLGAPSPYMIASDVAGELAKKSPSKIGIYWVDGPGYLKVGMRSTEDGPDVAAICERFGGNGHAHAAGFSLASSSYEFLSPHEDSIFSPPRNKRLIAVTAEPS